MTWIIVIVVIVGYILYKFWSDLQKDNKDLGGLTVDKKFKIIADTLNEEAFKGLGEVRLHPNDKRSFHLYRTGANQIIDFQYGTGHLVITWKLKYLGDNEVVVKETFRDVRNISDNEQIQIANSLIVKMEDLIR